MSAFTTKTLTFDLSELNAAMETHWNVHGHHAARSWSRLDTQLLGTTKFKWDNAKNCVVSFDYTADMLTPLLRLLGSLEDAHTNGSLMHS